MTFRSGIFKNSVFNKLFFLENYKLIQFNKNSADIYIKYNNNIYQ